MVGFIQAMACFPRVQSKAQAEIDHVVGSERLPTMEDANNLPYIRAIIKETLRWMPTTPTGGIPHAVTVDDEYNGYAIPKGAQLMNNVWAINMNESRFPNPREFCPERYEGDESTAAESAANPDPAKRDHFTFGAGRRICQGMHIAERSLFLGMSRILWGFKISPKIRDGKCVPIDTGKLTQGFVCLPDTFECQIVPRDSTRAMVIREEWQTSKKEILDPETFQLIYDIAK
jgi:cytochrome P450